MIAEPETQQIELSLDRKQIKTKMKRHSVVVVASALGLVVVAGLLVRLAMISAEMAAAEQRVAEAYSARLTGLAAEYAEREATRQRALVADSARWTALAHYYAEVEAKRERRWDAYSARLNGLAAYYGRPASSEASSQAAWDTLAARYAAQSVYLALETGNSDWLPECLAPLTLEQMPSLGDDDWRTTIPACE